jgi:hypothetical protein
MPLSASTVLAALAATLLFIIPNLGQIEEPWNIVVVSQTLELLRITFIAALAHALILGIPLFLVLRSRKQVGGITCALGGFLVGAVPFGALALMSMVGLQNASTGGKPTVVNGVPTLAGWIEYAHAFGSIGLIGLAGGLIFWVAMHASGQLASGAEQNAQTSKLSWGVTSAAVALTGAVLLLPSVIKDSSCHNLFRDGRTSIGPQISADLSLPTADWPTLTQIFVDFGAMHSLSFRADEQIHGGTLMWRDLNLCSEAGVNIDALDRPWLAQIGSPLADRGIQFSIYELRSGSEWKPLARELLNGIVKAWPQKTVFRGPDGKVVAAEEALQGRQ